MCSHVDRTSSRLEAVQTKLKAADRKVNPQQVGNTYDMWWIETTFCSQWMFFKESRGLTRSAF